MSPGKGYVDVSTIDPATAQQVAAAVRAKGGLFLEAPVSGSKGPAEQGQLIFLTAGACRCHSLCHRLCPIGSQQQRVCLTVSGSCGGHGCSL